MSTHVDTPNTVTHANTLIQVNRAQRSRDSAAWPVLMTKMETRLRARSARTKLPMGYEQDDFVMDVLVRVVESIDSFRPQESASFWSWFDCVADRITIDWLRHVRAAKRGGRRVPASLDQDQLEVGQIGQDCFDSPTAVARTHELNELALACADSLPPIYRRAQRARYLDPHATYDELGAKLGVAPDTLRTRVKRARHLMRLKLARVLEQYDLGG